MFDSCLILAGGRGTRLAPLTDVMPKPMVPVMGEPFIKYLIDYLISYGVSNIFILTGYRSEQFRHIVDEYASVRGVRITLLPTAENWNTAARVYNSIPYIRGSILICYGDVLAEPDLLAYYQSFESLGRLPTSISAISRHTKKQDHSITDSVPVEYKDIGFMAITKDSLQAVLTQPLQIKFEDLFHDALEVNVYKDPWPYCSLTDLQSLASLEKQLKEKVTLLLDRDGVINQLMPKGQYVQKSSDLLFNEQLLDQLQELSSSIERIVVITNQPWISSAPGAKVIHDDIKEVVIKRLRKISPEVEYLFCGHTPDEMCNCRKPKPGLLTSFLIDQPFLRRKAIFIGDSYPDSSMASFMSVDFYAVKYDRLIKGLSALGTAFKSKLSTHHRYYRLRGIPHGRFD